MQMCKSWSKTIPTDLLDRFRTFSLEDLEDFKQELFVFVHLYTDKYMNIVCVFLMQYSRNIYQQP